jgi:hypothetical protein
MDTQDNNLNTDINREVRRRLLKMAVYVPPVMLGVMSSIGTSQAGGAQLGTQKTCAGGGVIVVSAGGNACCPCVPTDPKYNPVKCNKKRCKLGYCPACKTIVFKSMKKCNKKVAAAGGCCTCTKIKTGPLKGKVKCI